MRLFDRLGIIRALFPAKSVASDVAVRWVRAVRAEPELIGDVIRLGAVLTLQPDTYDNGMPIGAPIDPTRLAYEAGRRDLATQILALMGLTHTELQSLMEEDYDVS